MESPSHRASIEVLATLRQHGWIDFTAVLLDAYRRWLGHELIDRRGTPDEVAERLFLAPRVVVAHGTQADPILCYGNRAALELWSVDIPTLLAMPSRLTAEPLERAERARLLERTARDGYVDDYRGVRISATGQRFLIEQAVVWNLVDAAGQRVGQAATFDRWVPVAADWRLERPSGSTGKT